jgi:hypothetical protein
MRLPKHAPRCLHGNAAVGQHSLCIPPPAAKTPCRLLCPVTVFRNAPRQHRITSSLREAEALLPDLGLSSLAEPFWQDCGMAGGGRWCFSTSSPEIIFTLRAGKNTALLKQAENTGRVWRINLVRAKTRQLPGASRTICEFSGGSPSLVWTVVRPTERIASSKGKKQILMYVSTSHHCSTSTCHHRLCPLFPSCVWGLVFCFYTPYVHPLVRPRCVGQLFP